jgi:hypothetical protein
LKSGTNDIHGTAYAYGRDQDMDAKNPYLPPSLPRATDNLEQFGASIGGPIKKNKIFYFGNYEGQRFIVGSPKVIQVPTTSSAAGLSDANSFPLAIFDIFHNAANTAHLQPSQLSLNLAGCNQSIAAMQAAASAAQITCDATNGLFGNASTSPSEATENNYIGGSDNALEKIDYHPNDKNALNGEYFLGDGNSDTPGGVQQG